MSYVYSVTVVVPIYHVENYVERCAVSLFEQKFDNIEYIFVDDASTDNSVAILKTVVERYPQRADHVRIIHNAENLGLFETRKVGVMAAGGEYIQHIDSDDWVETDMIATMYATAKADAADVVACDFQIHNVDGMQYQAETHPKSRDDRLTTLFATEIKANVWSRLVKREMYLAVYQALNLSKYHNMGEDKLLVMPLYCLANTIGYVPRGFYHYERRNSGALTKVNSVKSYQEAQFILRGSNGSGKSTLLKWIIEQMTVLPNNAYYIPQELHVYYGTILENIKLFSDDYDDEKRNTNNWWCRLCRLTHCISFSKNRVQYCCN